MKNMTISKRIWLGFITILTILLLLGILSDLGVNQIVSDATKVINSNKLDRNLAQKEIDHLNWATKVIALISDETTQKFSVQTDDHQCGFGKWLYGEGRKKAEALIPELASEFKAIEEPHRKLHQSAIKIKEAIEKNHDHLAAKAIYVSESISALHKVQEELHIIRATAKEHIIGEDQMLLAAERSQLIARILTILALLIGLPMAFFTARGVIRTLRKISGKMSSSSEEVSAAAIQIFSESNTVSEGASRQAASLEETSASLEEMSSMTRQNADNAAQADTLMHEATTVIKDAGISMDKLTKSMVEISTASSETQKIVKTIDEIAFQTNLLALNAAAATPKHS